MTEAPARAPTSLLPAGAGEVRVLEGPLGLENGAQLAQPRIAYQTWGRLNPARSNAVLICHALTGDQFVLGPHPVTGKPGWWEEIAGPGRPIDTDRYFVICSNVLGGCMGTTGPRETNPETGKPYGLDFPVITVGDMVEAQARLMDALGIDRLLAVVGGSMGGMQVLEWAARYPARIAAAISIASAARHTAQNIAFHEVGRQAIMADADWRGGDYIAAGTEPRKGLSIARMTAHITYLSEPAIARKFGRNLQDKDEISFGFDADFQVESYLRHQGSTFVERFDANSYLYITRAMDYFDLDARAPGGLAEVFQGSPTRFCLISFSSDWLFPTEETRHVVRALNAAAANVSFVEIASDKGHDAFLLDEPVMADTVRGFLNSVAEAEGA